MASIGTTQISNPDALHQRLTTLPIGKTAYYLLQRPDNITDWKQGYPSLDELQAFSEGRLFGEQGEVRWKQNADGYSCCWLSEGELPEGFGSLGEWEAESPQELFLHGSWDGHQWRETRLPRALHYPISPGKTPKLKVIAYKDRVTQTIRLTRFCRFIEGG